ncbi:hypothetical protein D9M68_794480 [compost metagenome]
MSGSVRVKGSASHRVVALSLMPCHLSSSTLPASSPMRRCMGRSPGSATGDGEEVTDSWRVITRPSAPPTPEALQLISTRLSWQAGGKPLISIPSWPSSRRTWPEPSEVPATMWLPASPWTSLNRSSWRYTGVPRASTSGEALTGWSRVAVVSKPTMALPTLQ